MTKPRQLFDSEGNYLKQQLLEQQDDERCESEALCIKVEILHHEHASQTALLLPKCGRVQKFTHPGEKKHEEEMTV